MLTKPEKHFNGEKVMKFIRANYGYIEKDKSGISVKYKDGETRGVISRVILRNLLSDKLIKKTIETKTFEIYKPNLK